MAVVRKLADDIGGRQVGTNGVREAGRYLLSELEDIRAVAEAERPDLDVEIDVQTTGRASPSGALPHPVLPHLTTTSRTSS